MLLDTQAVYVRATVLGFRSDATGALSGNWALNTNDQTPRDILIAADGGINVCRVGNALVEAPEVVYTPRQFTDSRYFRLRVTLRVHGATHASIGTSITQAASLTLNTLVSLLGGDVFGSGGAGVRLSFGGVVVVSRFTVTANQWYRVIFERVNDRALIYASATGASTPDGVPADSALTVFLDSTVAGASTAPVWAEIALSDTVSPIDATHYPGVSDFILEEFKPLPDLIVSPGGGGFQMPRGPYQRYKTLRAATDTLNSLVLGP